MVQLSARKSSVMLAVRPAEEDEEMELMVLEVSSSPYGSERLDAACAEQLEDADLAQVAPVAPIGVEGDVGHVVEDDLGGHEAGPGGEDEVVGVQHLLGGLEGRDDDVVDLPEAQAEEVGRVLSGQVTQGAVLRPPAEELVHVADDRELPWGRRRKVY